VTIARDDLTVASSLICVEFVGVEGAGLVLELESTLV